MQLSAGWPEGVRAISQYNVQPDLNDIIKDIKTRLQALSNTQATSIYTIATLPGASTVSAGTIVFCSDASSGSKFQGWDGSAWVPLG